MIHRLIGVGGLAVASAIASLVVAAPAFAGSVDPSFTTVPTVSAQAQEANAAFLAYAPPPAGGVDAMCLVDTGVNVNADIQNAIVSATAVDGGSGADVDPGEHGTVMAMTAAADGHGMWGAWPLLHIVSIRAAEPPPAGQPAEFTFDAYTLGIEQCLDEPSSYRIRVINLSFAAPLVPDGQQSEQFESEVAYADDLGVALVAAAGNSPGDVQDPAGESGVLGVGAVDASGAFCSFSATVNVPLFAPGCELDFADPSTDAPDCCGNGTSQASAFTSAVLVALMSYDPSLSYSAAENLLLSTASYDRLDVAAAFDAAGLQSVVAAGNAAIPQAAPASSPAAAPPAPPPYSPPSASPQLKVRGASWAAGKLHVSVSGLPSGDRVRIRLEYAREAPRSVWAKKATIVLRTARPTEVLVWMWNATKQLAGPIKARVS